MIYEKEHIKYLLECEKAINNPPSKHYKNDRGHFKKNFTMTSIDDKYLFRGFIRYNQKFIENFSVGLDYNPKEEKGTICLLRCNGPGGNKQILHHSTCHIHRATAETINAGLKPESNIDSTNEYATLEQAIQYFIKKINLSKNDRLNYFPEKPLELFESYE